MKLLQLLQLLQNVIIDTFNYENPINLIENDSLIIIVYQI